MIEKIKEYMKYRKNKKTAKRALVRIAATLLPAVQDTAEKGSDIINFIIRLAGASKDINGERLVEMVLGEISSTLQSNNGRMLETLTYMAALSPEDIRRILIHSAVETMPDNTGENP